jgi:plasmid stabilization system protein ParE
MELFFAEQGSEPLQWWYAKENEIIDYIEGLLAFHPYAGLAVERGSFKGLRRITYGRSKHVFLNYLIYYAVHEQDRVVDVINILPARTKRKRVVK